MPREHSGYGWRPFKPWAYPPPPTRPCLLILILCKQQSTGDKVFKCLRLMGDISFKPPYPLTLLHSLFSFFPSCPRSSISLFFSVVLSLSLGHVHYIFCGLCLFVAILWPLVNFTFQESGIYPPFQSCIKSPYYIWGNQENIVEKINEIIDNIFLGWRRF